MATYRQTFTYYEDGYGAVTVLVVMSDSFAGLFETDGTFETNVFVVDTSKNDLELSKGIAAQDEINIRVDESAAETDIDTDAVAFFRDAQDPATPRYIATFINTAALPDPPDVDDCEFIGQISTDLKANDTKHHGSQWGVDLNPTREWEGAASTFMDVSIEDIKLKDLIYGNVAEDVTGIDGTWETARVQDRLSYFKSPPGDYWGIRETKFEKLVNLSALLRKLADNLEQTLTDRGVGTYSIIIDDVTFDVELSPARFAPAEGYYYRYVGDILTPFFAKTRILKRMVFDTGGPFQILVDDQHVRGLGDSHTEDTFSPYIHYRMVKPENKGEEDLSFIKLDTFSDLLYEIAASFGMFVRFEQTSDTEIHVKWIARNDINEAAQVYIRDASDGSLDLSVTETSDDDKQHVGVSTRFTSDGEDYYVKNGEGVEGDSYKYRNRANSGVRPLLTVSNTYVSMEAGATDAGIRFDRDNNGFLPHNTVYYKNGVVEDYVAHPDRATLGLTTALFIEVAQSDEEYIDDDYIGLVHMPVGAVHAKIDEEDLVFGSLSEYVNHITGRDTQFFNAEYELTVPFLNGFSLNSDGSSPSWKHLQLGRHVVIEENSEPREFIIVGIERSYQNLETKIKLHRSSRMAYSVPGILAAPITPGIDFTATSSVGAASSETTRASFVATEEIAAGDAVAVDHTDGLTVYVRRATSNRVDFGRIIGIALTSGEEDDAVDVQTTGRVASTNFSFTPGLTVYVRTSTLPTINITQSRLTGITGNEDMVTSIGVADTTQSMPIELFKQYVLLEDSCPCG